jgi:predicted homoserine dehydrogenase-like protein
MPARASLERGGLPIGLAHGVKLTRRLAKGECVTWNDIVAPDTEAVRVRREMERRFAREPDPRTQGRETPE